MDRRWRTFGVIIASAAPSLARADLVPDHTGDGVRNVLDVAVERGLSPERVAPRGGAGVVTILPADSFIVAGDEIRLLVMIDAPGVEFFGYSLDVDIAPVGPSTGALTPDPLATNFFPSDNLIIAGGASLDPLFSVIQTTPDGGLFLTTNTSDASAIAPVAGVNDALAELVLDASLLASGEFRIELGPATAFAGADGLAVPLSFSSASIVVEAREITGRMHYETGDTDGSNNAFGEREPVSVSDPECAYISGKLQENRDLGRAPDTYLFVFDKDDNVLCEDDDSSLLGNGKASACYGIAPVDNGDGTSSVRLGITGRPDGADHAFNGLFFNAPHEQRGEAQVRVSYRDANGAPLGEDVYLCAFVTGAEAHRVNFLAPAGTDSVDVEIDNTTETFPLCDDVDFYQIDGLDPACDYAVTIVGGSDHAGGRPCAVLGWYDKNGALVSVASDREDRNGDAGQGAQLSIISDANGRARLAVSGEGDTDFDGLALSPEPPRNVETPGYEAPPAHGCCACYTIKVERNKHPEESGPAGCDDPLFIQLALGDLNLDGGIDILDIAIMLNHWGWIAP